MKGMLATVTRATMTGTETIVGRVTATLAEGETITHVTVEGTVAHETVRGLPLPVTEREGEPVTVTMAPLHSRHPHLMTVELL